jgi:outer membrane receptor protein involved in Fe transport
MGKARLGSAFVLAVAGAASLAAVWPRAAHADDELAEVIVTAERRSEKVQDIPVAITAISAADLEQRGIRQAGDIAAAVPNLTISSAYGEEAQPSFTLRGVTTTDFSENQSSPIAMYVDEVYKSVGALQALQVFDLDRVEVLRGPQGTLYGKNATGGAISFYSKSPSLTDYDGYATLGVGNFDAHNLRAAVGGPIIDGVLGWRAAVLYEERDGWMDSIVPGVRPLNGVNAVAGRFSLLFKPSDVFSALLKLSVSRSGGTPYGAHALNNDPTVTGFDGNIGWFQNGAKYAIDKDIRSDSASLKLDWEVAPHLSLTSVTGFDFGRWYEKSDDGGLPVYLDDPNTYFSTVNAFSQEVRIATHDMGPLEFLGGAYYGRDDVHATVQFHFFDGFPGSFYLPSGQELYGFDEYNNFDQIRETKAAFVNTTFAATDTVTFRAGVRYTKDSIAIKNFYALEGGLPAAPTTLLPDDTATLWTPTIAALPAAYTNFQTGLQAQGATYPELSKSNSNVSFKAGVDWKPLDDVLTYLNFSQGYRGAAFNGQAYNAPAELTFAQPEKLNSYELGVKSELWQRRAMLNADVFYYDYRNQQFLDTFGLPGGGSGFRVVNAPKSRVAGAEVEFRANLSGDFTVGATLGLLQSKYQELELHGLSRAGNRLIGAPDFSAGANADWRAARFAVGDVHVQLNGNYYSKQYYDALNTERIAQDGYALLNGRIALIAARYEVAVWGKNLTNKQYLVYGLAQRNPSDGGLGFDYALVGEPRTYGLELTAKF